MLKKAKTTIAGITAAAMLAAGSIAIVPAAQAAAPGVYGDAQLVLAGYKDGWKGGKGWKGDKGWKGGHKRHRGHGGNDFPTALFGFAAGAILGSVLSQPHYSGGGWDAYCSSKYQTYKPWTGTFTGYDGDEHRCR